MKIKVCPKCYDSGKEIMACIHGCDEDEYCFECMFMAVCTLRIMIPKDKDIHVEWCEECAEEL